jgi:hypothetical protein
MMDEPTSALTTFLAALPYRAREAFAPVSVDTLRAINTCADAGQDITALAKTCAKGLDKRTRHDIRGLLNLRVRRAAGIDDIEGDA